MMGDRCEAEDGMSIYDHHISAVVWIDDMVRLALGLSVLSFHFSKLSLLHGLGWGHEELDEQIGWLLLVLIRIARDTSRHDHGNGHARIAVRVRSVHVNARSWFGRVSVELDSVIDGILTIDKGE
jgi:hypothetical protein